jgi:hypothetical protein
VDRFIHPVGPEPPAVYWRRRAAVVAGIVVVIVVLVMIVKALASGGDDDASPPKPKNSPTVVASSASPDKSAEAPACTKEQLTGAGLAEGADILLTKDKEAYGPGEQVMLKAKVKNMGAADCSLPNNAHNVVLNVVSGSDRIFNSADCAGNVPDDAGDLITLKAGEETEIPVAWDATRSQQGCPEIKETPARARDATYVATVTVVGVPSDQTQFLLTP